MKQLLTKVLCLLLIGGFSLSAQAQFSNNWRTKEGNFEFGSMAGLSFYLGDIVGSPLQWQAYRPCAGLTARYAKSKFWNVRSSFTYANIAGDDALSTSISRHERNLSFKSSILELAVGAEINLFGFEPVSTTKKFTPYGFAGIAVYHFNPKALYKGTWYALQPLGTEGQGIPGYGQKYKLTQLSIPFGGGLKVGLRMSDGNFVTISGEFGIRKTFTDYLDDLSGKYVDLAYLEKNNGKMAAELSIRTDEYLGYPVTAKFDSTRGSPKNKDYYFISGITVAYIFYKKNYKYHFAH